MAKKPAGASNEPQTVLEVVGSILARAGSQGIDSEVKLTVRGLGTPLDSFRIRLPKGAELGAGSPSGYTLAPAASDAASGEGRKTYEVRLARKTEGPVEVQFMARTPYPRPAEGAAGWCEVAGYEVVGASRQSGRVAVAAGRSWQVAFGPADQVRQIERPADLSRAEGVVAAFEYAEPLPVAGAGRGGDGPAERRAGVPILVDADRATLKGKLRYRVRGETDSLALELPGWQLDDAGPDSLVDPGEAIGQSGTIWLPLAQRPTGPWR